MKKLLTGLALVALLAGCATRENENGMGGTSDQTISTEQTTTTSDQSRTSDQSMKTDSINKTTSGNVKDANSPDARNNGGLGIKERNLFTDLDHSRLIVEGANLGCRDHFDFPLLLERIHGGGGV